MYNKSQTVKKYHEIQSQKTQGFRVADFATLSNERTSRRKFFYSFNMDKRTLRSKIEGLARAKILGISQTKINTYGSNTSLVIYSFGIRGN